MLRVKRLESKEESRVRRRLPGMKFQDGECPYDCIDLKTEGLVCGCNEHKLTDKRIDAVHLFGRHWNVGCAFEKTQQRIKEMERELDIQKRALRIAINIQEGRDPLDGV